ncbi:MAG: hypothetical protein LBU32_26575 [Clostridiales bacterium]|nr:hypothetical protein [Clostridiales bacterium]
MEGDKKEAKTYAIEARRGCVGKTMTTDFRAFGLSLNCKNTWEYPEMKQKTACSYGGVESFGQAVLRSWSRATRAFSSAHFCMSIATTAIYR